MVRIQIQLDAAQHRRVKKRARELGVSVSEVIRRSVAATLASAGDERAELGRRALAVAGRHADPAGPGRIAEGHDTALAEAYRR